MYILFMSFACIKCPGTKGYNEKVSITWRQDTEKRYSLIIMGRKVFSCMENSKVLRGKTI